MARTLIVCNYFLSQTVFSYLLLLLLFIADNMLVVHSRLIMLDGLLLFFSAASVLCYLKFHKEFER